MKQFKAFEHEKGLYITCNANFYENPSYYFFPLVKICMRTMVTVSRNLGVLSSVLYPLIRLQLVV